MTLCYEWDVETIDEYGDIVDHDHNDRLTASHLEVEEPNKLVLVRDNYKADGLDRSWAYVKNGLLPEYFKDAYDNVLFRERVPQRFHLELKSLQRTKG